jgi:hypothetical protein
LIQFADASEILFSTKDPYFIPYRDACLRCCFGRQEFDQQISLIFKNTIKSPNDSRDPAFVPQRDEFDQQISLIFKNTIKSANDSRDPAFVPQRDEFDQQISLRFTYEIWVSLTFRYKNF